MTSQEAYYKSLWNNIPGDIRNEINNQIECGEFYAIVAEDYMYEQTIYALTKLGFGVFHDKENKCYTIIWS